MHENELLKGYYKDFSFPKGDKRNVKGNGDLSWSEFVFEFSQQVAEL